MAGQHGHDLRARERNAKSTAAEEGMPEGPDLVATYLGDGSTGCKHGITSDQNSRDHRSRHDLATVGLAVAAAGPAG